MWAESLRPFVVPFAFELFPLSLSVDRKETNSVSDTHTMARRLSRHSIVTSEGVDENLWQKTAFSDLF